MALTTVPASLSATALTLTTAAQPNITSLGTLSALTISGDLTVDTSTLKVDSSNNRVGIGVSSLTEKLEVSGSINATNQSTNFAAGAQRGFLDMVNASKHVRIGSLTGAATATGTQGTVEIIVNNSARVVVDENGNVGIGDTNPGFPLHVKSSGTDIAKFESSGSYTFTRFSSSSRNWALSVGSSFSIYDETGSQTLLALDSSGNLSLQGTAVIQPSGASLLPSLKLNNNGYLGSASTPTAIQIATGGDVTFSGTIAGTLATAAQTNITSLGTLTGLSISAGTSTHGLSFGANVPSAGQTILTYHDGNTRSGFGIVSGVHRMFTNNGASLSFGEVSTSDGSTYTERMRIHSNGNVGIGESNPDASLHITSNTPIISLDESDASKEYRIGSYGGAFAIRDETASNYRVVVTGTGNVGIGVTDPTANLEIYAASTASHINMLKLTMPSWSNSVNYLKNIVWEDTGNDLAGIGLLYSGSQAIMHFHSFYNGGYKSESDILMTLTGTGRLGIGETAPDRRLHVKSGANSDDGAFRIESANSNIMDMGTGSIGHFINCVNTDPFSIKMAGVEKFRIDNSASAGHLQMGAFGVSGLNTTAAIHGAGNDAALVISNGNLANSNTAYGWQGRGGRLLASNGTGWQSADGSDPGLVIGSDNSATLRNHIGIALHNENNADSRWSPIIGFSNKSNSGSYNTMYAYIVGRKVGQGADANWSSGEIHMDTAGTRTGTSTRTAYMADIPAFMMDQHGDINMPYKAYAYGKVNGNITSPTNDYGIALTTDRYQNCTPQTTGHGPGITITKAGFYIMSMSFLYNPSGNYIYSGWCINGSLQHHYHSNHVISSNHDAQSTIGRYLNVGDHLTIENGNNTVITTIYGNVHSAWYICKIG